MPTDKSKFQEITISRPEPAADDWFDLYDDISKSVDRYDKNLMLSDLHGLKEIGDEVTYYRRTRLKSQNCQHVYGTDYICGVDEDGHDLPLWRAMKVYLLTKADLVLKMSRPRGGRRERWSTQAVVQEKRRKGERVNDEELDKYDKRTRWFLIITLFAIAIMSLIGIIIITRG